MASTFPTSADVLTDTFTDTTATVTVHAAAHDAVADGIMAVEKYLLGSQTGNVPMIGVNVLAYGADPTGAADSTSAFNNAIGALPAGGGTVWVPIGTYKINSTINIGNGTTSGVSTTSGIVLSGVCPPGLNSDFLTGVNPQGPCKLLANGCNPMISVNGPVSGWGIRNLILDGNAQSGANGVQILSASGGDCSNLVIRNFGEIHIITECRQATGALASINCNSSNNYFRNIAITVPDSANTPAALWTSGNFTDASSISTYNVYENISIALPTTTGSHAVYGIRIEDCTGDTFRNVRMTNSHSGTGSTLAVQYSYQIVASNPGPSDTRIEGIDFGSASASIGNSGTPLGSNTPNRIVSVAARNGQPSNPSLSNLDWGYSNSSP